MAPYLAAYYQDSGTTDPGGADDERLYLAVSADGNTFNPIGRVTTNGIVRDPSVLPPSLAPDGRWHIACTNHTFATPTPNDSIDIYTGPTPLGLAPEPQTVDCSALKDSGTVNWAWAPEWFKDSDGTIYLIISISTNPDASLFQFLTWALPATNSSLTTWGTPVKIGTGFYQAIDTYVVKRDSTYYAFIKSGSIQMHTAPSFPAGPWTLVHTDATSGDAGNAEAPDLLDMGGGTWRLYYDKWSEDGRIKYTVSSNTFATFGASSYVTSVDRMRHTSIIDLAGEGPVDLVAEGGKRAPVGDVT